MKLHLSDNLVIIHVKQALKRIKFDFIFVEDFFLHIWNELSLLVLKKKYRKAHVCTQQSMHGFGVCFSE